MNAHSLTQIPGGPIDYAGKHWSGLIRDYYGVRAQLLLDQAVADAAKGEKLDQTAVDLAFAQHAYNWTNAQNKYPQTVTGDAIEVSKAMLAKYSPYYAACSA